MSVTSKNRHRRERKRLKQKLLSKVVIKMEAKIQTGTKLSMDELVKKVQHG